MTATPPVCPPPAIKGAASAVAAPAASALGAGNRSAWLHIAAFLDLFPNRPLEDHARRIGAQAAMGGQAQRRTPDAAGVQTLPVGNHGENLNESQA